MLRHILYCISGHLPARFIDHEGKPYMERHYLFTIFNRRVYLHRFVGSDPDGVHDHPFLYSWSIILAGWYWEHKWGGVVSKKRWFNRIGPSDFHRVVLPDNGKDVWTIFVHSPRVRPWGFLRPNDAIGEGVHAYIPQSDKDDPPFSNWHLTAKKAKELRELIRNIPAGKVSI